MSEPRYVELYLHEDTFGLEDELAEIDYEARYGDDVARMIRDEHLAWKQLRHWLDEAAIVAVEWGMDRVGDGHGGGLLAEWIVALERHLGRPLLPDPDPKPKGRSPISATKRVRVFARDGYRCCVCGEDDPEALTLDHMIPWSKGGSDEDYNLRTLCRPCNSRKGTK